jgi:hypothetical protein
MISCKNPYCDIDAILRTVNYTAHRNTVLLHQCTTVADLHLIHTSYLFSGLVNVDTACLLLVCFFKNEILYNVIIRFNYLHPIPESYLQPCPSQWPRGLRHELSSPSSNTGIVSSNSTRGMDVCMCLFCGCVVLCVGSGLATG